MARAAGGQFLIRVEDIDRARCSADFEAAMLADLARLGITSDGPIRRQSEHFDAYAGALHRLKATGLVYPAFLSRADIKRAVAAYEAAGEHWPRDPDGAPLYPGNDRDLSADVAARRIAAGEQVIWRLDMVRAIERVGPLAWRESGGDEPPNDVDLAALAGRRQDRTIDAHPQQWGDVILARADVPTSYHLSVVVDDAVQGVTDVVRGADLFAATSVHRLLQELLGLPAPRYHHHALVRDATGRKLAKSDGDAGLRSLFDRGLSADEIARLAGLGWRAVRFPEC
jgi:glutamyl-Q tRNA(Asp) synthetase